MPFGFGRGRGWGRGWGPPPWAWGMPAWGPYAEPTDEDLKAEIESLNEEKKDIDAEIAEVEKMLKGKGGK